MNKPYGNQYKNRYARGIGWERKASSCHGHPFRRARLS